MNITLGPADFKGTTIKTAFEQMRANAIINAENNARGMSIINFNIATFLTKRRQPDALFILGLWAIQPLKQNFERFREQPSQGQNALERRAENLMNNLKQREDVPNEFAQTALEHVKNLIKEEISLIETLQTA